MKDVRGKIRRTRTATSVQVHIRHFAGLLAAIQAYVPQHPLIVNIYAVVTPLTSRSCADRPIYWLFSIWIPNLKCAGVSPSTQRARKSSTSSPNSPTCPAVDRRPHLTVHPHFAPVFPQNSLRTPKIHSEHQNVIPSEAEESKPSIHNPSLPQPTHHPPNSRHPRPRSGISAGHGGATPVTQCHRIPCTGHNPLVGAGFKSPPWGGATATSTFLTTRGPPVKIRDIPPFTNQNTRSNINLSRVLTRRPCQPTSSERNGGQLRGIEVSSPRIKARYD